MRKIMRKEVKTTKVQIASVTMENGKPKIGGISEVTLLGNLTNDKVQAEIASKYGFGLTILSVSHETNLYKMEVEEFIKVAKISSPDLEEDEEIDTEEE